MILEGTRERMSTILYFFAGGLTDGVGTPSKRVREAPLKWRLVDGQNKEVQNCGKSRQNVKGDSILGMTPAIFWGKLG